MPRLRILDSTAKAFSTFYHDFSLRRLWVDDSDVTGRNIILRLFASFIFTIGVLPLYENFAFPVLEFLRPKWRFERTDVRRALLRGPQYVPTQRSLYATSQFYPRWLIKVTYNRLQNTEAEYELHIVECDDRTERNKILEKGYTAISYAFKNAKELFLEINPGISENNIPPDPDSPLTTSDRLMTAWIQANDSNNPDRERWKKVAIRQRVAMAFLNRYLEASFAHRAAQRQFDDTEYVWLDEFCLYPPGKPDLGARDDELGRMADIFSSASAVCVYCPNDTCDHVDEKCDWGSRLWTLSEILHTGCVVALTRSKDPVTLVEHYTLTSQPGRDFRARMQHTAEAKGQWHLQAIMRHANNGGSTTWQHSIHALITEAIIRNERSKESNKYLAKALNGLLPRRAHPSDLHGRDGWADLAWLLELNQGFYNSASLAAVCGLGESKMQSQGWLGPPVSPAAGNERLEPLVTAFPVQDGLFIMRPRIIGLRSNLKRDILGLYRNEDLLPVRIIIGVASITPILCIPFFPLLAVFWPTIAGVTFLSCVFLYAFSFLINFLGMTAYVERNGIILLPDAKDNKTAEDYLGQRDHKLSELQAWGEDQLIPVWKSSLEERLVKEVLFVDLVGRVSTKFIVRRSEEKVPNALVPLAVHGCGITCLVLYHDDPYQPATKLGIVNMPAHILTFGEEVGSLVVAGLRE